MSDYEASLSRKSIDNLHDLPAFKQWLVVQPFNIEVLRRVEVPFQGKNPNGLTLRAHIPTLRLMEVQLSPYLQSKLMRLAEQQGRDSAALIAEAVERMVIFDEWFISEVDKGLVAANRGEFVEHKALRALIDSRYPAE